MQIKNTRRYHLTPIRMAVIKKQVSIGKEVDKREPSCTVSENVNWNGNLEQDCGSLHNFEIGIPGTLFSLYIVAILEDKCKSR